MQAGRSTVRRGRAGRRVVAGLLAVPLVEIVVAVLVAGVVGWGWVVLAVLALSALGTFVLRRAVASAGRTVVRDGVAVTTGPAAGSRSPVDTALVVVAGLLLLVPGLVTGALGLLLLLPPVRAVVRPALGAAAARAAQAAMSRVTVRGVGGWQAPGDPQHGPFLGGGPVVRGDANPLDDDRR